MLWLRWFVLTDRHQGDGESAHDGSEPHEHGTGAYVYPEVKAAAWNVGRFIAGVVVMRLW